MQASCQTSPKINGFAFTFKHSLFSSIVISHVHEPSPQNPSSHLSRRSDAPGPRTSSLRAPQKVRTIKRLPATQSHPRETTSNIRRHESNPTPRKDTSDGRRRTRSQLYFAANRGAVGVLRWNLVFANPVNTSTLILPPGEFSRSLHLPCGPEENPTSMRLQTSTCIEMTQASRQYQPSPGNFSS